ncbi:MAG TPA: di-heme oxidoredictase family protein [Terriglobales bacterium]|nr:di-heme oxidoredictase family protein [Terriglobales bacterium]
MNYQNVRRILVCLGGLAIATSGLSAQTDPGPRSGPAAAGNYYPTLNSSEQYFFNQAISRFMEVDSVAGTIPGENGLGLGPTFNGNSCAMCHAQPAIGGSSPGTASPQNPIANPQVALATVDTGTNAVPSFITASGPVREARFIKNPNGTADGGVHGLYTITGRSDAQGCTLSQPNFNQAVSSNNVIFRIPTPTFGLGLVEATPDSTLRANLAANQSAKSQLGISGVLNTSGNDGTVTRFGWKAQNKSLAIFSGEAYNVEQGVSNEVFPNERSATPGCVFNGTPEDASNMMNGNTLSTNYGLNVGTIAEMSSDMIDFSAFMRLSAPPAPGPQTTSTQNGAQLFSRIGCALCHSQTLTTGSTRYTGMSNVAYHPYSDFALHHMGGELADDISQGGAGPDQFRTAPLWGLGQRLYFLHDGRTSNLLTAIEDHADCGGNGRTNRGEFSHQAASTHNCSSESNGVVSNFNRLSPSQKQDLLNFLRSL